jgi:hypothetical protein
MFMLLKNRPRCFLLCVTQKPYQKYHLYAEHIHRLLRLDLGVDKLTALTWDEREQEFQRRALGLPDEHFRLLLPAVYQHFSLYCNGLIKQDTSKSILQEDKTCVML